MIEVKRPTDFFSLPFFFLFSTLPLNVMLSHMARFVKANQKGRAFSICISWKAKL